MINLLVVIQQEPIKIDHLLKLLGQLVKQQEESKIDH
jgi:hypothetical protein